MNYGNSSAIVIVFGTEEIIYFLAQFCIQPLTDYVELKSKRK